MTPARAWIGALLFAVLCGCASSPDVHFIRDPEASFEGLETYSWMPRKDSGDTLIDDARLEQRVRGMVDAELSARGFALAGAAEPDFLVGYFPVLRREVSVERVHEAYDYTGDPFWGEGYIPDHEAVGDPQTIEREFYKGTLILDIADPSTKQPVWRATAEMPIDLDESQSTTDRKIREAVRLMLAGFPPEER
jgi:hypothetical protein